MVSDETFITNISVNCIHTEVMTLHTQVISLSGSQPAFFQQIGQ